MRNHNIKLTPADDNYIDKLGRDIEVISWFIKSYSKYDYSDSDQYEIADMYSDFCKSVYGENWVYLTEDNINRVLFRFLGYHDGINANMWAIAHEEDESLKQSIKSNTTIIRRLSSGRICIMPYFDEFSPECMKCENRSQCRSLHSASRQVYDSSCTSDLCSNNPWYFD